MKIVIGMLAAIALGVLVLAGVLAFHNKPIPPELWGTGGLSGVVLAIAGLSGPHLDKAPPPRTPEDPTPQRTEDKQ